MFVAMAALGLGVTLSIVAVADPLGQVTEFSSGISPAAQPWLITTGPDGNLWFTEYGRNKIGRISTAGAITEYGLCRSFHAFFNGAP